MCIDVHLLFAHHPAHCPLCPAVVNQLVKAGVIDDVFSLCFGMVEGDGVLLLGDADVPGTIPMQYTPLLTSASHPFYYNVKMLSIAIDGQLLAVPQVGACVCRWVRNAQRSRSPSLCEVVVSYRHRRCLQEPNCALVAAPLLRPCSTRGTAQFWTAAPPSRTCPHLRSACLLQVRHPSQGAAAVPCSLSVKPLCVKHLLLLTAAVEKFALGKGLKRVAGPDPKYQDICFGEAPHHQDLEVGKLAVVELECRALLVEPGRALLSCTAEPRRQLQLLHPFLPPPGPFQDVPQHGAAV